MPLLKLAEQKLSCDGKPLSPWAGKAPHFKTPGSSGAVNTGKLQHEKLVAIADKLAKYPQYIESIHSVLFSSSYPISTAIENTGGKGSWEGPYKQVGCIPPEWMASWLVRRLQTKDGGLTSDILDSLHAADRDHIPSLFSFETQLGLKCPLPKAVQSDEVMASKMFSKRADLVGPRVQILLDNGCVGKNFLSFKVGAFSLVMEGEKAVEVVHNPSKMRVDIPAHTPITKGFHIVDNILDCSAKAEKSPASYQLASFFPDSAAWKQHDISDKKAKALECIAEELVQAAENAAREDESAKVYDGNLLKGAAAKRKQADTERARKAVKEQQRKRGLKRQLSVN